MSSVSWGMWSLSHRARVIKLIAATLIRAVTAGLRPLRMAFMLVISPYFFKRNMTIMHMIRAGDTKPMVASMEPGTQQP